MQVEVYIEDQLLSSDFNRNWNVSTGFNKTPNYIIYEIRPLKKVLIHADGQTGKTKLYDLYEL
jgi:hypothetical protein